MNVVSIILIILLIVRLIGQIVQAAASSANTIHLAVFALFAVIYAASIFGIIKKMRWGAILVMAVAVLDMLSASFLGGVRGFGAAIFDLPLLGLGYWAYRKY